jgi:hypothetical protein
MDLLDVVSIVSGRMVTSAVGGGKLPEEDGEMTDGWQRVGVRIRDDATGHMAPDGSGNALNHRTTLPP